MPFLALAAAAVVVQAAPLPAPLPALPSACKADPLMATAFSGAPQARRLGDLPQGRLIHAVVLSQGGCDYMDVRLPGAGPGGEHWARLATGAPARGAVTPVSPGR